MILTRAQAWTKGGAKGVHPQGPQCYGAPRQKLKIITIIVFKCFSPVI